MIIQAKGLTKDYIIYNKKSGLKNSLKDFFNRQYTTKTAVSNLDIMIDKGEIVGLIGENGAGKTTTLKMLSGILYPTAGEISVCGYIPIERKKDFLKKIAFIMGNRNQLVWDLPALDSFRYQQKIYEIEEAEFKKQLGMLVDLFNVEKLLNIPIRNLSLGQRMKMELINSFIYSPEIIFLDEPTIGLDLDSQMAIRNFIKEYNNLAKATIIVTSHYMADIEGTSKRVVILHSGEKIFDDKLTELYKQYKDEVIVNVSFRGQVDKASIEAIGQIIDWSNDKMRISVTQARKKELIKVLMNESDSIEDFAISDIPFEVIIKKVTNGELIV